MRGSIRLLSLVTVLFSIVLYNVNSAQAQAWVPLQGEGNVSLVYSYFKGGDHLFSTDDIDGLVTVGYEAEGNRWYLGDTYLQNLQLVLDYGITNRLAFLGSVSYAITRYEGRAPVDLTVDNGDYNWSFQDFGFQLRYLMLLHPVVVTPFTGLGLPVTDYATNGHAAIGKGLNEWNLGLSLGWVPAPWIPKGYMHGQFLYAIGEKVDDIRVNRVSVDVEAGYFPTSSLSMRVVGSYLNSPGGSDWVGGEKPTHGHAGETVSTRFSDSSYVRLGLGAGVSAIKDLWIFATFLTTVNGENTEDGNMLILGTSWSFVSPFSS